MLTACVLLLVPAASATVIGRGVISSGNQQVTVSLTSIDWGPAGGTTGTFVVANDPGDGTDNLTYDSGTEVPDGTIGNIMDLSIPGPPVTLNFLAFPTIPNLTFDLFGFFPGSANTSCAGLAIGQSCSIAPGSPFVLTRSGGGTSVTLAGFGTATDGSPILSNWTGTFTTQLSNVTPETIQTNFLTIPNFQVKSSFSAELIATPIPEPVTSGFVGLGLILVGLAGRRFRRS